MHHPGPVSIGRPAARLDGERSRIRILDAAERLLSDKGFSGTGVAAISRASGLPPSSIYWFFENKQELMIAVVERAADRFLTLMETAPHSREGLREMFETGLAQLGGQLPEFLRLRFQLALERGDIDPALTERLGGVHERVSKLAADAIEASLAKVSNPATRDQIEELAPFALAIGNGALISAQLEPDGIDLASLPEELEVAVQAVAKHRLEKKGNQ